MEKEEKPPNSLKIFAVDNIAINQEISTVVVSITPLKGETETHFYSLTTSSEEIVKQVIKTTGATLTPVYYEKITETIERSKESISDGIDIESKVNLHALSGGGSFKIKRKPVKETKTTTREIYRADP